MDSWVVSWVSVWKGGRELGVEGVSKRRVKVICYVRVLGGIERW